MIARSPPACSGVDTMSARRTLITKKAQCLDVSRFSTENPVRSSYKTGAHIMSNQVIERKQNGQFAKGVSGNLGGNAQRTRHLFSKAFVEALLEDFREWGPEAIARVRTETPAAYL